MTTHAKGMASRAATWRRPAAGAPQGRWVRRATYHGRYRVLLKDGPPCTRRTLGMDSDDTLPHRLAMRSTTAVHLSKLPVDARKLHGRGQARVHRVQGTGHEGRGGHRRGGVGHIEPPRKVWTRRRWGGNTTRTSKGVTHASRRGSQRGVDTAVPLLPTVGTQAAALQRERQRQWPACRLPLRTSARTARSGPGESTPGLGTWTTNPRTHTGRELPQALRAPHLSREERGKVG
jgi:hypothetical protein